MNPALARTCIHEAGHAIVARALGVVCTGAAITDDSSGWCRTGRASPTEDLAIMFGGIEAERILFGSARVAQVAGDLANIERLARRYRMADAAVEDMRPQVRAVLRQHWDKVERVAAVLARQRYLPGMLIDSLSWGWLALMVRNSQRRLTGADIDPVCGPAVRRKQ
jgi:hypothetical protein